MCATLTPAVGVLTRPTYSSMIFGLFPADSMRVGCGIRVGIMVQHRSKPPARCTSRCRKHSVWCQVLGWRSGSPGLHLILGGAVVSPGVVLAFGWRSGLPLR